MVEPLGNAPRFLHCQRSDFLLVDGPVYSENDSSNMADNLFEKGSQSFFAAD